MRRWAILALLLLWALSWSGSAEVSEGSDPGEAAGEAREEEAGDPFLSVEPALKAAGFDAFAGLSEALGGVDARALMRKAMSGTLEWDEAWTTSALVRAEQALKAMFLETLRALALPVLSGVALRLLLDGSGAGAVGLLCRMACSALMMERFAQAGQIARDMLDGVQKLVDALSPVLVSAMTLSGADAAAAALSPASAVCVSLMQRILSEVGLPLCNLAAIVASAANLSEKFQLNRLFDLLKRVAVTGVRLTATGFVGVMALEGVLATGQDAAGVRILRRAIQGAVPIVGAQVSDAATALMGSAAALKNALGVTGAAAVIGACAKPVTKLAIFMLSLQLAAAVLEPVADPGVVRITAHFSELARMLLAICAGCAMLAILLIGAGAMLAAG